MALLACSLWISGAITAMRSVRSRSAREGRIPTRAHAPARAEDGTSLLPSVDEDPRCLLMDSADGGQEDVKGVELNHEEHSWQNGANGVTGRLVERLLPNSTHAALARCLTHRCSRRGRCFAGTLVCSALIAAFALATLAYEMADESCACASVIDAAGWFVRDPEHGGRCPARDGGQFAELVLTRSRAWPPSSSNSPAASAAGTIGPAHASRHALCVVVGGSHGIGYAVAEALARTSCDTLYVTSRSAASATAAAAALTRAVPAGRSPRVLGLPLDLAHFSSVRAFATELRQREARVDLLVLNAGIIGQAAAGGADAPAGMTTDGYEVTWQVNYLSHVLLWLLLRPLLRHSDAPRVVSVTSAEHKHMASWGDEPSDWAALTQPLTIQPLSGEFGLREYRASKLAQVIFTAILASGSLEAPPAAGPLQGRPIVARAVYPGRHVATGAFDMIPWPLNVVAKSRMLSWEEGSRAVVFAALADEAPTHEEDGSGLFCSADCRGRKPNHLALDAKLQTRLWNWTLAALANEQNDVA